MLTELCAYLKNWFERSMIYGTITIHDGRVLLYEDVMQDGQYFRIVGSIFNDGVYMHSEESGNDELKDETFDGAVWLMAVPREVISLADEIQQWRDKNEALDSNAMSPYDSESFGGYSYSKSSGTSETGGGIGGWQTAFSNRLARWRKI